MLMDIVDLAWLTGDGGFGRRRRRRQLSRVTPHLVGPEMCVGEKHSVTRVRGFGRPIQALRR